VMEPSGAYNMAHAALLRLRPKMLPIDRKTEMVRLSRFKKDLEHEAAELEAALEAGFKSLTPARAAKHPELFDERFRKWADTEQYYRQVVDIIREIEYRETGQEEVEFERIVNRQKAGQADRESPVSQRELFARNG